MLQWMKKNLTLWLCLTLLTSVSYAKELTDSLVAKRIDQFSSSHLGKPYIASPLGEGVGYDKDPLYRFDVFDCTTFVETVLAQAISLNKEEFIQNLNLIRYKNGKVSFLNRNHMTSTDWIHNNQKAGYVTDITRELFMDQYDVSITAIDKAAWAHRVHKMNLKESMTVSELDYLPIDSALAHPGLIKRIASGSIINIVRPNWQLKEKIGTNLDVSHQGFAILKQNGVIYFRHASQKTKTVTEEPLLQYLNRIAKDKSIGGINVLAPLH